MMNLTELFKRMTLGMVLTSVPMLAVCAPTEINWSEEVKLHDGKIIVIKRHEELGRSGLPLAHRGARKFWHFCYPPMAIQWKSKPDYFPEVFDIVDGKAYVRVSIGSCESCMLHGYPETNALYFVWEGKAWKKIGDKEFPPGLRVNILGNTHYDDDGARDVQGLITVKQKEDREPNMSRLMRQRPEIVGRNDTLAFRDACKNCKGVHVQTDGTPEVFLPVTDRDCK